MRTQQNRPATCTLACLACIGATLSACRAPLPTYPERPVPESLAVLADRAERLQTFSGAGTLSVRDAQKGTVTLEAAVVARRPDQIRVRAWKLGRSVADITLSGDDVSAKTDRRVEQTTLIDGVRALRAVLLDIDANLYRAAQPLDTSDSASIVIQTPADAGLNGEPIRAHIDRRTLTLRSLTIEADQPQASFQLDRYRQTPWAEDANNSAQPDTTVWPMRITAKNGTREAVYRFDWVELNAELARGALPDHEAQP